MSHYRPNNAHPNAPPVPAFYSNAPVPAAHPIPMGYPQVPPMPYGVPIIPPMGMVPPAMPVAPTVTRPGDLKTMTPAENQNSRPKVHSAFVKHPIGIDVDLLNEIFKVCVATGLLFAYSCSNRNAVSHLWNGGRIWIHQRTSQRISGLRSSRISLALPEPSAFWETLR